MNASRLVRSEAIPAQDGLCKDEGRASKRFLRPPGPMTPRVPGPNRPGTGREVGIMNADRHPLSLSMSLVAAAMLIVVPAAADDGNTIHACKKNRGDVRLVDDADQCLPSETLVEWGVQGPSGPPGVVETHVHTAVETNAGGALRFALCEPGEVALGGGYTTSLFVEVAWDAPAVNEEGIIHFPDEGETPNAWAVQVDVPDSSDDEVTLHVRVICALTGDGS